MTYLPARVLNAVAIAAAALLTACGGGSEGAPPVAGVVTAPPPAVVCTRTVTVALPGDSTQYGIDGASPVEDRAVHNPGVELQARMDEEFGVGRVVVTDYGVPGTVAGDAGRPVMSADVISPNYGLNDARYGVSTEEFMGNMLSMHPTLIETPFPRLDGDPLLGAEQGYIEAERASGVPVADVNAYVRSLPNWEQYFPLPYSGHATDELYKLVVDNVLAPAVGAQVRAVLDKAGCGG